MSFFRIELSQHHCQLKAGALCITSGRKYTAIEIKRAVASDPEPDTGAESEPAPSEDPFWKKPVEEHPDVRSRAQKAADRALASIRSRQAPAKLPKTRASQPQYEVLFGLALRSRRVASLFRGTVAFLLTHNVGLQGAAIC